MGNVVSRYLACFDTEIIEYTRRGGDSTDDNVRLVDYLEFTDVDVESNDT